MHRQRLNRIPYSVTVTKNERQRKCVACMDADYSNQAKRKDYMEKHYIPNVSFAFDNFEDFFTEREQLLVAALRKELA